MTSRRNCFSKSGALQPVFWSSLMLLVGAAVQPGAWAQARRGGVQAAPPPQQQNANGMHIYIWAGLKSHGPGQHDYPQFLADWSKILTEHGAVVDGALHPPAAPTSSVPMPS